MGARQPLMAPAARTFLLLLLARLSLHEVWSLTLLVTPPVASFACGANLPTFAICQRLRSHPFSTAASLCWRMAFSTLLPCCFLPTRPCASQPYRRPLLGVAWCNHPRRSLALPSPTAYVSRLLHDFSAAFPKWQLVSAAFPKWRLVSAAFYEWQV